MPEDSEALPSNIQPERTKSGLFSKLFSKNQPNPAGSRTEVVSSPTPIQIESSQPEIASAQEAIKRAEVKPMGPLDRDLQKAQADFARLSPDLLASGITEEQINTARTNAETRLTAEYKEAQAQDPLFRVETALTSAARTPEDQALAKFINRGIETQRDKLAKMYDQAKLAAIHAGQSEPTVEGFLRGIRSNETTVDLNFTYTNTADIPEAEDRASLTASVDFRTRALTNLGILADGDPLDQLKRFPAQKDNLKPWVYKQGDEVVATHNLPTNIEGVLAGVRFGQFAGVTLDLKPNDIAKALNNQAGATTV